MKTPLLTKENLENYLQRSDALGLSGADLKLVGSHNHVIYRASKDGAVYALRMTNTNYRSDKWLTMEEEFAILRFFDQRRIKVGPRVYVLDQSRFDVPLVFQEYVEGICFNKIPSPTTQQLKEVAKTIASINQFGPGPETLGFMKRYCEKVNFRRDLWRWRARLLDAVRRYPSFDNIKWVRKIWGLTSKAYRALIPFQGCFENADWGFHFDAAHAGNTYLRNQAALFLDWQKVSWRNDPSFTLVRFMTSLDRSGQVPHVVFKILLEEYSKWHQVPHLVNMAWARLLERQMSDLVWTLWDNAKQDNPRPVEETSVVIRYRNLKQRLL